MALTKDQLTKRQELITLAEAKATKKLDTIVRFNAGKDHGAAANVLTQCDWDVALAKEVLALWILEILTPQYCSLTSLLYFTPELLPRARKRLYKPTYEVRNKQQPDTGEYSLEREET